MKKLEKIKKLSLNKKKVAKLSDHEAHRVKGGRRGGPSDPPTEPTTSDFAKFG